MSPSRANVALSPRRLLARWRLERCRHDRRRLELRRRAQATLLAWPALSWKPALASTFSSSSIPTLSPASPSNLPPASPSRLPPASLTSVLAALPTSTHALIEPIPTHSDLPLVSSVPEVLTQRTPRTLCNASPHISPFDTSPPAPSIAPFRLDYGLRASQPDLATADGIVERATYQTAFNQTRSLEGPWQSGNEDFEVEPPADEPRRPPDKRTMKLGHTLRILQSRLPNLLASPLPTEILSPHISLHLFPSTHPHLPTASGRVAYHAALWTSPIAWGRVPLVGNVNLEILSERMIKGGAPLPRAHRSSSSGAADESGQFRPNGQVSRHQAGNEKLVVRWRTCRGPRNSPPTFSSAAPELPQSSRLTPASSPPTTTEPDLPDSVSESKEDVIAFPTTSQPQPMQRNTASANDEMCGLFIFEFDEQGRILTHVIEKAEWGTDWEQGVGRVVGLTDWLLGRFGKRGDAGSSGSSSGSGSDSGREGGRGLLDPPLPAPGLALGYRVPVMMPLYCAPVMRSRV